MSQPFSLCFGRSYGCSIRNVSNTSSFSSGTRGFNAGGTFSFFFEAWLPSVWLSSSSTKLRSLVVAPESFFCLTGFSFFVEGDFEGMCGLRGSVSSSSPSLSPSSALRPKILCLHQHRGLRSSESQRKRERGEKR